MLREPQQPQPSRIDGDCETSDTNAGVQQHESTDKEHPTRAADSSFSSSANHGQVSSAADRLAPALGGHIEHRYQIECEHRAHCQAPLQHDAQILRQLGSRADA